MNAKTVFFLGGSDLEMTTVRHLLIEKGIPFEDKNLNWDNAFLSKYSDVFDKYKGYSIYGVELKNDLNDTPSGYYLIDHHNELSNYPSTLEQVSEILGHKLTEREKLIAANDKGYIPAMEKLGATKEQITEIRRLDRIEQGVTKVEEEEAIKSLSTKETYGNLIIIHTSSKRFSPITDALYPYKALLIVSTKNKSFCYYGLGASKMHNITKSNWTTYYGSGINGFFGGYLDENIPAKEADSEISMLINAIKQQYINA